MLGRVSQATLQKAGSDARYLALYRLACETYDARTRKSGLPYDGKLIAYFSAEYGLTEALPVYSGGLGILSGDHLKSSSDQDYPLIGLGLLYQQGYFRQIPESRRLAAGTLPDQRFLHSAGYAGEGCRRSGSEGHGPPAHRRRVYPGLEAGCGPHHALPAGHQHSGKRAAAGSRYHRFAVRRRHRYAHPPGNRAGHRRDARAEGHGAQAHGLSHERRPFGVSGAGADPAVHARRKTELRRSAGGCPHQQRLHHPHPGAGGNRSVRSRPDVPLLFRLLQRDRHRFPAVDGAGAAQRLRSRRALLHGGAGAEYLVLSQRGEPAASRSLAGNVPRPVAATAGVGSADHVASPTACICRAG